MSNLWKGKDEISTTVVSRNDLVTLNYLMALLGSPVETA